MMPSRFIKDSYTPDDVESLESFLRERGTFAFPKLNGLFVAGNVTSAAEYTGYKNVWVRDCCLVAHAHLVTGNPHIASDAANALLQYFSKKKQADRFEAIVADPHISEDVMRRPHIRFDGEALEDIPKNWPHAQNDALGYFVWLYSTLVRERHLEMSPEAATTIGRFPRYFEAIRYWKDKDSGHWEEERKVSASSIGAVMGGLRALESLELPTVFREAQGPPGLLSELISKGETELNKLLPSESLEPRDRRRLYDAALLFLAYPLDVLDSATEALILEQTRKYLKGHIGIRRYLGDSFWSPNYKQQLSPEQRTAPVDEVGTRSDLAEIGKEAQWCIFDSIMSVIYGRKYLFGRRQGKASKDALHEQIHYFNRALTQVTFPNSTIELTLNRVRRLFGLSSKRFYLCPELYYLRDGQWEPGDVTPLLWAQANLKLAFFALKESLAEKS